MSYHDVLSALVQALQREPSEESFEFLRTDQGGVISHPRLPGGELRVHVDDVEILSRKGFITPITKQTIQEFKLLRHR
jgi:hypothetical protein